MKSVGIIANPASGKDIRRLISQSRLVPNQEKINILKRILGGLEAGGIDKVLFMPDYSNLAKSAANEYHGLIQTEILNVPIFNKDIDTINSVKEMIQRDVSVIIALGGDGTSRAVSIASESVPILPVSTGTNNVFPFMVEGTLAGISTAYIVQHPESLSICAPVQKKFDIETDSGIRDISLVDIAVSKEYFVGSRAIWNINSVSELFLAIAEPHTIGLSSIGGWANPINRNESRGLHIRFSEKPTGYSVSAPMVPGILSEVYIESINVIEKNQMNEVSLSPSTIALDGERTIPIREGEKVQVTLNTNGPTVLNPFIAIREAAKNNFLNNWNKL